MYPMTPPPSLAGSPFTTAPVTACASRVTVIESRSTAVTPSNSETSLVSEPTHGPLLEQEVWTTSREQFSQSRPETHDARDGKPQIVINDTAQNGHNVVDPQQQQQQPPQAPQQLHLDGSDVHGAVAAVGDVEPVKDADEEEQAEDESEDAEVDMESRYRIACFQRKTMKVFEPLVPEGYVFSHRSARDFLLTKAYNGMVTLKRSSELSSHLYHLPRADYLEELVSNTDKEWVSRKREGL